ncbi:DNA polymerase zeta catalytic subunit isoform X1 [Typha angustifolia]|uniref:DNA polymerase zeta catalytic subunit isoform X1 n=2 Tax=Typha angustifolia TaxID=59011 RepID=UPI003C2B51F1
MASPPEPNPVLSVRIVSLDYYMAPPIPDLDFCYSPFHGEKTEEVPVIRIFGSTPAGQKTCLHVHRALPYFYVRCPDELLQDPDEVNKCMTGFINAIEKALKMRSASKRQHVHGYNLVRAKTLYGYHFMEEFFVKIYLYYPQEVAHAARLLLGGAILNRMLQPYESHIPYLLHFLVDYNLYGMSHIHVSNMKFRPPLPDAFDSKIACDVEDFMKLKEKSVSVTASLQADLDSDAVGNPAIWISSTVPNASLWEDSASGHVTIERTGVNLIRRQSTSMLEADSSVDDILNEKYKMYTSLSQVTSETKMVQSLLPIWEEFQRSGMQEAVKLPDISKPQPENVLRSFLHDLRYENALSELLPEEKISFQNVSAVSDSGKLEKCITASTNIAGLIEDTEQKNLSNANYGTFRCTEEESWKKRLSFGFSCKENEDTIHSEMNYECQELMSTNLQGSSSQMVEAGDLKSMDSDAIGLLSWLASSQAAEDLTTDDELMNEAILSPLFQTKSYKVALETAHLDYECASQQECQDILDSAEGDIASEGQKEQTSCLDVNMHMGSASSGDPFSIDMSTENDEVSLSLVKKCKTRKSISKRERNELPWGPLPLSTKKREEKVTKPASIESSENLLEYHGDSTASSLSKGDKSHHASVVNAGTDSYGRIAGKALVTCSVRDLMRRKRCFISEQTESESPRIKMIPEDKANNTLDSCLVAPDFHAISNDLSNARSHHGVEGNLASSITCSEALRASEFVFPEQMSLPNDRNSGSNRAGDLVSAKNYGTEFRGITGLSAAVKNNVLQSGIQMTFIRQPPSKDQVDTIMDDSPSSIGQAARQGLNDPLPFFSRSFEMKKRYESFQHVGNLNSQESALGILTHFQNDGSILYVLTHAISPPTLESVQEWLLQDLRGTICINNDSGGSKTSISLLAQDPSSKINDSLQASGEGLDSSCSEKASFSQQDTLGDACDSSLLQARVALHLNSNVPKSVQCKNISAQSGSFFVRVNSIPSKSTLDGVQMKQKMASDILHDVSQISFLDEKPELTPLSQIGFRDPASVGHGQQLTIMSIEVLAGCRGDLRPDPRHDAINIISLAVEDDASHTFEVYVLLCAKNDVPFKSNVDGVSGVKIFIFFEEKHLLDRLADMISSIDPDVLMGWEIQGGSVGFLAERAAHLGISLLKKISRIPTHEVKRRANDSAADSEVMQSETSIADVILEDMVEDDWSRTHASGVHVTGRIVLNLWRLIRTEVKLNMYSVEAVAEEVLRRKIPLIPCRILNKWFSSGPGRARYRCIEYIMERAKLNLQIVNQLDMINRTSELARVFGIDFFSVLSRGSQFRVESMLLRLAHTQNYLAISPGSHQVASQPAMECLPLVMEPESGFYADPVVVLDFQSLYPSMIIAYNLCFCTCLGKVFPSKTNVLGVSSYSPDQHVLVDLKDQLLLAPNGVFYVPSKVRKGVLPRLLEEILSTRIMVKQAMKKLMPSQQVLQRVFFSFTNYKLIYNARQLALKLIANVTYGYTAAGFSGRMPCAELADSIVQCGRRTLETAISFVNEHPMWKARVVYGDTDSMFVLLKGRSLEEAFRIGKEIASAVTAMNPDPVTLKLEKVYYPCFLLTKKRYVGYSYESTDQKHATFDAKGIETVRRDTCPAVSKILERSIRLIFEHQDMTEVKSYVLRQWTRILSGKVSLQDFIFAKEVRLGTYSLRSSSLPPAAIVATKAMMVDPRAEPHYGERIPYVVIHGEPGARLIDMVVDPYDLLQIDSPYRLNDLYYINKQIIPALQRVFGLLGVDLNRWFSEMPRPVRPTLAKRHSYMSRSASFRSSDDSSLVYPKKPQSKGSRIDTYYLSKHCILCGRLTQKSDYLCDNCSKNEAFVAAVVAGSTSKLEREIQHLSAICRNCGGADWIVESGVKCTSLACPVFFERRKVQKELQSVSKSAAQAGFYPTCMPELF